VLIGATNFKDSLDAAAIREGRFDYKVEITPPDQEARRKLMEHGVSKYAPALKADPDALQSVADRWAGFSVSRIVSVCKRLSAVGKQHNWESIGFEQWMQALRDTQGAQGKLPPNTKRLSDLVLPEDTYKALQSVANRFVASHTYEQLGGALPSGLLFYGPSGTGKTVAAKALALESGWSFFAVAGPDLIADRSKLAQIYRQAKDARPALIFIDEADEILRDRSRSHYSDMVNKLLVMMDGAEEKIKDVVFIAATNHPEQIDSALLRAGRFTEKVEFAAPSSDHLPKHIAGWFKRKSGAAKVRLAPELDAFDLAELLQGQTIASVDGVLQYAVNCAADRYRVGEDGVIVMQSDIETAMRIVLTEQT
jgi:transitional endoplasmic reticulum ATPase